MDQYQLVAAVLWGGFQVVHDRPCRWPVRTAPLSAGAGAEMGRGPVAMTSCLLGAAFIYLACSWHFTLLVLTGGAFSFVFVLWGHSRLCHSRFRRLRPGVE